MDQDNAGTENPIAPDSASSTNEETATKTTVEPVTFPSQTTPTQSENQPKTNNALKITTAICVILALGGIAFGVYELMDSNQKSSTISALENEKSEKEAKIAELETTISNLEAESETQSEKENTTESTEETNPTTETTTTQPADTSATSEAPTIQLISEVADTDTTKVYKIGECTADSGTGASPHYSLKCHVTINGKDSLISYHDGDNNILRLSLPKN